MCVCVFVCVGDVWVAHTHSHTHTDTHTVEKSLSHTLARTHTLCDTQAGREGGICCLQLSLLLYLIFCATDQNIHHGEC